MRAENIQVVIDTDVNVVVTLLESVGRRKGKAEVTQKGKALCLESVVEPFIMPGQRDLLF